MKTMLLVLVGLLVLPCACLAGQARAPLDTEGLPEYLQDRGEGVPSSMFGIFIQERQLIVYGYFEYYKDADYEYKPSELGYTEGRDYRGEYEGFEELLFIGYGLSDRLALELEAAYISSELKKGTDHDDPTFPDAIEESGIGDVETQLRWRWTTETANRPEVFSYFETVFPTQDKGSLIGTTDWEIKLGTGVIRGFGMGTWAARVAAEYDAEESKVEIGEAALEYIKRLSSHWRVYGGVEGTQDEWELITEAQWHLTGHVLLKLNSAFGLTSKAPDWAPEVGVMFSF